MFDKLFDIITSIWDALLPFVVLEPFEAGVLVRLGKFVRVLEPGFHWVYPLHIDKIWNEHTVPRTHHLQGLSTTTRDGKTIGFDAVVTYQISDIEKALLRVTDVKDAVIDTCMGVIGTELSETTWDEVLHGTVVDGLTKACKARGRKWGIEIMSVQLAGVATVKNLRLSGLSGQHTMEIAL